jgi:hypothetical protein
VCGSARLAKPGIGRLFQPYRAQPKIMIMNQLTCHPKPQVPPARVSSRGSTAWIGEVVDIAAGEAALTEIRACLAGKSEEEEGTVAVLTNQDGTPIQPVGLVDEMAALSLSPMNRLVQQEGSPLLELIVAGIPADAFVVQLTCKLLHALVQERFAESGGVKTRRKGVVSSVARFEWVRGWWPVEEQPSWLTRWDAQTCQVIAGGGGLEVLMHVRENGCEWDQFTCREAARGGHLEVLQWARANGCEWDEVTCWSAAAGGHLEVLQWARVNGCEWDEFTCWFSAAGGHLEVLQWARANGCEWDSTTCSRAAAGGHLEVLQWARANGCEWDEETCRLAAGRGHLEVLQWARAHGCEWDEEECERLAQENEHVTVVEWMEEQRRQVFG